MAATSIAVVYAEKSGIIRRFYSADTDEELLRAVGTGPGEKAIFLSFKDYSLKNDEEIRAAVAKVIGEPTKSGRCVEIDPKGVVVNCYHADPEIDQPLDAANVMEEHDVADIGHVKLKTTGEFVSPDPVVVPTAKEALDQATLYAATLTELTGKIMSAEEIQASADSTVALKTEQSQKAALAVAQVSAAEATPG